MTRCLTSILVLAGLASSSVAEAADSADRLVQTSYCPAKGDDGKKKDFLLTHHLTQAGTWWLELAPAAGSITPHMPIKIDPAKAEMHDGVKDSGIKPFVIVSGNVKGEDYVYVVNSTLTVDNGSITKIEASLIGSKKGASDLSVLSTVVCGNPPAAAATPSKAKGKTKAKKK